MSGWQEDVQPSIEQGQDGLEADGDLYLRHEPDTTRRRPLWIAGDIERPLTAGLESESRTTNSPYRRIDWCKSRVMVDTQASERQPYCHLGRKEDPSYDENEPRPKIQGEGSLEASSQ